MARPLPRSARTVRGCAPGSAQTGEVDLTILIRASNFEESLQQTIDAYARRRGITVDYVVTEGSWPEHYEPNAAHAAQGVLADLTPFIERDGIPLEEFVPQGVESFRT